MKKERNIYLDYAATTPIDPRVVQAMMPYLKSDFGNPGSLHSFGQKAIAAVDMAREMIARSIDANFREIIFTGSATEANNMVLKGIVKRFVSLGLIAKPSVIISSIEHESVLETARQLEKDGVEIIYLPVNKKGEVDLKKLAEAINERTVLVSVMYANNEIGTIQPIREIGKIIQEFRETLSRSQNQKIQSLKPFPYPVFHTDAVQAFQYCEHSVKELGVDMMTISAHKIYGPKGIGALYVAEDIRIKDGGISTLLAGGGQEFGMRSGTENVPAIVGFSRAVESVQEFYGNLEKENQKIKKLKDTLLIGIKKIYPKASINGDEGSSKAASLPNILNVYFPGYDAQDIVTRLDLLGVAVSAGSACRSRAMQGSYVIEALGYGKERSKSSIRFSFGRPTTMEEIRSTLRALKKIKG